MPATTRSTWCSSPRRLHATLATTLAANGPSARTGATPSCITHAAGGESPGNPRQDWLPLAPELLGPNTRDSPMGRCTIRGHHRQLWEGMLHPAGPRTDRGEPRPRG